MEHKVSVIVPVYNAERYLRPCIESVLNQDYKNIELILVDDGSVDSSPQICQSYTDSRVKYFRKENGGVSSARNFGLNIISEGYVTFMDADDYLPNNAISLLVESLESSESDITVGSYKLIYGDKGMAHSARLAPGTYLIKELLSGFIDDGTLSGFILGSVWATLYKVDIINHNKLLFDIQIKNNEDGLFNFEYALNSNKLSVIGNCVYNYRQYDSSSTSKRRQDYDFNTLIYNHLNELSWDKESNRFEGQMKARNVSLALWDILKYPQCMKLREGVSYISKKTSSSEVREGWNYISFNKLSKYKKVIAYLMRFRLNLLLYIVVRFLYPYLGKRIRR